MSSPAAEKFRARIDSGKGTVSNRAVIVSKGLTAWLKSHAPPEAPTPRGFRKQHFFRSLFSLAQANEHMAES
jgi:hypothetical protein